MELQTNNHSVFSLNYHLVLVVKYRRQVINDTISTRLREIFESIQPNYNITLEEWKEADYDKQVVSLFQNLSALWICKR